MAASALSEPYSYYGPRRNQRQPEAPPEDYSAARRVILATSIGLGLGMLAQPQWLFPSKDEDQPAGLKLAGGTPPPTTPQSIDDPIAEMTATFELSSQTSAAGWSAPDRGNLWEVENSWLRPRTSGLFTPSRGMTNGSMAYLVQILQGGANFLFRAQDLGNHYAVRLRNSQSPSEPMALQAVIVRNGVESILSQERIAETVTWFRTIHHLDVQLDGNFFTARLNGTIVGTWRDRTFGKGAIGVDVTPSDEFRVYQGKVTPA